MFARLAARKFLEKFYPGESTFVDISDYASRVNLDGPSSGCSEVESKEPKVEQVPGGCLHFAISLVPEAHPLAEDRVATIVLLGAQDLPVPDSIKDILSGQIQHVYFVIERGFSRTVSQPEVDCEGCPEFEEEVSVEVFQENKQAALVEFDQENSIITVKIHRKEPPKSKHMQYPGQESEDADEKKNDDEGEEEENPEAEEVDDLHDELIAFCEFNLWDLVEIERGNYQVDLVERISKTFDCLEPENAIRVLSNECHETMDNPYGRSLIEISDFQDSYSEEIPGINDKNWRFKVQMSADHANQLAGSLLGEKLKGYVQDALDPEEEDDDEEDDEDPEAAELQERIFIAQKQFKRTIQSLRAVDGAFPQFFALPIFCFNFANLGGFSQESCGSIVKWYLAQSSI